MLLTMMKCKLHRATVTGADLEYEGSVSIDPALCDKVGLLYNEKVDILNINNGERFSTYVIPGGPGEICLNGAAARLAHRGDKVIIVAYAQMDQSEALNHKPNVLLLNDKNEVVDKSF
jgi:aspartate 1-decarboxylase